MSTWNNIMHCDVPTSSLAARAISCGVLRHGRQLLWRRAQALGASRAAARAAAVATAAAAAVPRLRAAGGPRRPARRRQWLRRPHPLLRAHGAEALAAEEEAQAALAAAGLEGLQGRGRGKEGSPVGLRAGRGGAGSAAEDRLNGAALCGCGRGGVRAACTCSELMPCCSKQALVACAEGRGGGG